MAFVAATPLPAPGLAELAGRLDALRSALLRFRLAEATGRVRRPLVLHADAETYPAAPDLRLVQQDLDTVQIVGDDLRLEPSEPDEPRLVDPDGGNNHELVRRAQNGDAEAFGQLYDRYVDMVHRYVYYRVGSQALAEDLTSETFLRALRRISSYTWQGVDIGAWFVTIARNLVADHYKSSRFRLEVQVQEVRDDRSVDGPEDEVLDSLDHRVLLEAVTKLGPEQQECIVLRFLQGLSVSETAAVMGKNDGAIKALQYRAIRSLSRLLPDGFVR